MEARLQHAGRYGQPGSWQRRRGDESPAAPSGVRAPGFPPAPPQATRKRARRHHPDGAALTAEPATVLDSRELRRRSRKAKVVTPPSPRLRLPRPIRRLQRQAPVYAIQGISGLSTRLREATGREVIDMARVVEIIQFLYQQRELARRGPDYAVDDFGFDAQWTESLLPLFKAMYRDYWRGGEDGGEKVSAPRRGAARRQPPR